MNPLSRVQHRLHRNRIWLWLVALVLATGSGWEATAQTAASPTPLYRWTTLAGHPTTGYADGPADEALFNSPRGIAVDLNDNTYVADTANHVIRKISAQGVVTTLAGSPGNPGSADGTGSVARFAFPSDVAVDAAGNVFVADTENYTVRKITPEGVVTTLAGKAGESGDAVGPLDEARFSRITHLVSDKLGNVYIGNRRITSSGVEKVSFNSDDPVFSKDGRPTGEVSIMRMTVDVDGNYYLTVKLKDSNDAAGNGSYNISRIIKLSTDGSYSILASSEPSDGKPYLFISANTIHMTNDVFGNVYYVTKLVSSSHIYGVYRISPEGSIEAAHWQNASRGGDGDDPIDIASDSQGHIIHTTASDDVIFKTEDYELKILAGTLWANRGKDGTSVEARFANITALAIDDDSQLLIGDSQSSYSVHSYVWFCIKRGSATGESTTLYTSRTREQSSVIVGGIAMDESGNIFVGSDWGITELKPDGTTNDLPLDPNIQIRGLNFLPDGRLIAAGRNLVTRRSLTGDWSILAGANQIHEIQDGIGTAAHFYNIRDLIISSNGDIYMLDDASTRTNDNAVVIREITPDLAVTTITNNLIKSDGATPQSMTLDDKGDFLLTYSDDTVRLLTANGKEYIIGGQSGIFGTRDGLGNEARFYAPSKITTDPDNNIYVADNAGSIIRKGEFLGVNTTITGQPQSLTVETGATAEFSVTATGTPQPTYQWYFKNVAINNATSDTLTISNAQTSNAGSYTVTVSNSLGSVTSSEAILTVTTPSTPPPSSSGGNNSGSNNSGGSSGSTSNSGGGGAPSGWFLLTLGAAALTKFYRRNRA